MTGGSLFSGIGGMDLGLERAGIHTLWQCEIDPFRRSILSTHWPNTPRYEDVRSLDDTAKRVDILFGGFPCQDLSTAGARKGIHAERSGLFFEFARLAGELRPAWLLIENVPGLLSSPSSEPGKDFALVLSTLAECGYGVAWRILDSRYFGVPQSRRRVFIVGHLGGPCPPEVLFEPEGGEWDPPARGKTGEEIAHALRASPRGVDEHTGTAYIPEVSYSLLGNRSPHRRLSGDSETYVPEVSVPLRGRSHGKSSNRPGRGGEDAHNLVYSLRRAQTSSNGWGIQEDVAHHLDRSGPDAVAFALEDISGKQSGGKEVGLGAREGSMYTLQRGHQHGGAFSENQRAETALTDYAHQLSGAGGKPGQGYPAALVGTEADTDGVREVAGVSRRLDGSRYAALGDANTVPVVEWIGRRIVRASL